MAVAILDTVLGLLAVYLTSVWYRKKFNSRYGHLPLPPGPKGWPIIGNLWDLQTGYEWKAYHNWCKEFGSSSILWRFNGIFLSLRSRRYRHYLFKCCWYIDSRSRHIWRSDGTSRKAVFTLLRKVKFRKELWLFVYSLMASQGKIAND